MKETIKMKKFDTTVGGYTEETYELPIKKFIKNCSLKPEYFVTKQKILDYLEANNISISSTELKKPELIDEILEAMTLELLLDMADNVGIGIDCFKYFEVGLNAEEYKENYKKLKAVGRVKYAENKYRNLYSIKQYLEYRENPENFFDNLAEDEFMDIPEEELAGLPFK